MSLHRLRDDDLPPLYQAADTSSSVAQKHFLLATRIRLIGLVAASAFGLATWKIAASSTDWAGVLAASCFAVALVMEGYVLKAKPERTWYEGRAAAESVKTLSWRYAVGGEPFNIGLNQEHEVEELFLLQIHSVLETLNELDLVSPKSSSEQITTQMRAIRRASLDDRKQVYEDGRVANQQAWYQNKSVWNRRRATAWATGMVIAEIGGIIAGILKAVGVIRSDVLSFAGAAVAAVSAWIQTKQHRTLATAYAVTALELASVGTKIHYQTTEADWAKFVSEAEEAFSREHTLWKASRGVRSI